MPRNHGLSRMAIGTLLLMAGGSVLAHGQQEFPGNRPFQPLVPGLGSGGGGDPVSFAGEYRIVPGTREGVVSIKATIEPEWHLYSSTQKAGGPIPSRLQLQPNSSVTLLRPFVADRPPHVKPPDVDFPVPTEEYAGEVAWNAPVLVAESADPTKLNLEVQFNGQACQTGSCVPLSRISIPVTYAGEATPSRRGEYSTPRVHAKIRGTIQPRTVVPGSTVTLTITAEPAPQFHVYAWGRQDENGPFKPTLILWKERFGWTASEPVASAAPHVAPSQGNLPPLQYYEQPVTWTVSLQVPADAPAAGFELKGIVGYQTCKETNCDPPTAAEFSAVVAVVKAGEPVDADSEPLTFKTGAYAVAARLAKEQLATNPSAVVETGGNPPSRESLAPPAPLTTKELPVPEVAATNYSGPLLEVGKLQPVGGFDERQPIWVMLPTALLAGFILNFMPCVLPVIGLKIVSFVQQAGQKRSQVLLLNLWYSAGILAVFMVLATLAIFAGLGWGQQFQSATFNVVLTSIVFAFALSFLGVWEIPIPGFVGSSGANMVAEQEGAVGAFFKGALTTVLATPCSGPMLIPALAWAFKQPPLVTFAVFVCVGLGMAAPYLLVGAFPRLISFLPKPGAWMDTFKHMMGFVLLGTVVYLLTIIPLPMVVPTVGFMMGLWAGLWWIGQVPVWEELQKRLRAWAVGAAFATGVGMFCFQWLYGVTSSRFDETVVTRYNSPAFQAQLAAKHTAGGDSQHLSWKPYSVELMSKALFQDKRIVFLDFTADWCQTCKVNERVALNIPETKAFIESKGIETIKADMTSDSPLQQEMLERLGGTAIPYYAVFSPADPYRPLVMEGLLTPGRVREALEQAMNHSGNSVAALSPP